MKKAVRIFLMYLLFLADSILIGTFFYSLYLNSLSMVAGWHTPFLDNENLMRAFFVVCEVTAFLMGIILITYKVSHPSGAGWQLGAFVFVMLINWGLLLPGTIILEKNYLSRHDAIESDEIEGLLSGGYFRQAGDSVYYFMDDLWPEYNEDEDFTKVVRIDTTEKGQVIVFETKDPKTLSVVNDASPYRDVLIRNVFMRRQSQKILFFDDLVKQAKRNLGNGIFSFLGFLSLAFALCCVFGVSGISDWKLVNFTLTIFITGLIFFWNHFYFDPALQKFRELGFMNNGFFRLLGRFSEAPFLFITNIVFGLILIIIGVVNMIVKSKAKKNLEG